MPPFRFQHGHGCEAQYADPASTQEPWCSCEDRARAAYDDEADARGDRERNGDNEHEGRDE